MKLAGGIFVASLLGLASVGWPSAPAQAGTLTLTCELLSSGPNPACPASAPMYAVPGQYNYADSFGTGVGTTAISGSNIYGGPVYGSLGPAGFIDDYFFKITPAQADVVSATIDLGGVFAVNGLFARIYSVSSNPSGLVLTQPAGAVDYGTVTPSGPVTLVQINPVTLNAGSYVLEITGTTAGTSGGSYTGTLNLNPVPLPAALPLLLSGLGMLGLLVWRGRQGPAGGALRLA